MNKTTLLKGTCRTMVALCAEAIKKERRAPDTSFPTLGEMACLGLIASGENHTTSFITKDGKLQFTVANETMVGCYDLDAETLVGAFEFTRVSTISDLEMFQATLTRKSAQQLAATVSSCMGLSDYDRAENTAQMPLDRYQFLEAAVDELKKRLQTLQSLL